jgi:hypothetical protein
MDFLYDDYWPRNGRYPSWGRGVYGAIFGVCVELDVFGRPRKGKKILSSCVSQFLWLVAWFDMNSQQQRIFFSPHGDNQFFSSPHGDINFFFPSRQESIFLCLTAIINFFFASRQ